VEALGEALADASRKPPEAFRMAETVSPVDLDKLPSVIRLP
jgi:hypothetical protein